MIMFMASGVSLIAMNIVAFYIYSRLDKFSGREIAVILPSYIVGVAILLIMFTLSLRDVLEV